MIRTPSLIPLVTLALMAACASGPDLDGELPYDTLSEYRFFEGPQRDFVPTAGVLPFEPASPLWSDAAAKVRHLALRPGETVGYDAVGEWVFPVPSAVTKTFTTFDGAPVETRVLLNLDSGWEAYTYLWDADLEDAERVDDGAVLTVDLGAGDQEFVIPSAEECGWCHDQAGEARLLAITGPQAARQVERDGQSVDQVQWLADQGLFGDEQPDDSAVVALPDPHGDASLDDRARSYLHTNCAHCHRDGARADQEGLRFSFTEVDLEAVGVCRTPASTGAGAGGLDHVIVPGAPDESIIMFRMESSSLSLLMPEWFTRTTDVAGVALVRDWIDAMEPVDCD